MIPLTLIGAIFASVDLREFGIRSIKLLLRGRIEGRERAGSYLKVWGDPSIPFLSGELKGSHTNMQCLTMRGGITHIHLWFTWF
jgi:hypothetical protein